jgi:hypothetical protein
MWVFREAIKFNDIFISRERFYVFFSVYGVGMALTFPTGGAASVAATSDRISDNTGPYFCFPLELSHRISEYSQLHKNAYVQLQISGLIAIYMPFVMDSYETRLWSIVLLENLQISQVVKKFCVLYRTLWFSTMSTGGLHWTLS